MASPFLVFYIVYSTEMQARQELRVAQLFALFRTFPHDIARKVFGLVEDETRADDLALAKLLKHQARIEVSEIFQALRIVGNQLAVRACEETGDFYTATRYSRRIQQISAATVARSIRWPELSRHERARLVGVPGVSLSLGTRYAIASVEDLEPGARQTFNAFARIFTRAHVANLRTPRYFRGMWSRDGAAFLERFEVQGLPTLYDIELPTLDQLREYLEAFDEFLIGEDFGTDDDTDDELPALFDQ
jgi:hypothetical protein